jgi:hypothetical protein
MEWWWFNGIESPARILKREQIIEILFYIGSGCE